MRKIQFKGNGRLFYYPVFFLIASLYLTSPSFAFKEKEPPKNTTDINAITIDNFPKPPSPMETDSLVSIDLPSSINFNDKSEVDALINYLKKDKSFLDNLIGPLSIDNFKISYFETEKADSGIFVYVQFIQQIDGINVNNTYLDLDILLPFKGNAKIVYANVAVYPDLKLEPPITNKIDEDKIKNTIAQLFKINPSQVEKGNDIIRYFFDSNNNGTPRWLKISTYTTKPSTYTAYVDQTSGEIIAFVDERHYYHLYDGNADASGITQEPLSPPSTLTPLKDVKINYSNTLSTYTNQNGYYSFYAPDPPNFTVNLKGRWTNVQNQAGLNFLPQISSPVVGRNNFLFNAYGEFMTAQVNAYYYTESIHDYAKSKLNTNRLDLMLPVNVNINSSCNAYFDSGANALSINFFKSSSECHNTSYSDIIFHEYGHFIDYQFGDITDSSEGHGLSEGWGDTFACFASQQSTIGRNFFVNPVNGSTDGRSCDNHYSYPENLDDEPHQLGQAWSGFAWHLRNNLIQRYGQSTGVQIAENIVLPSIKANPHNARGAIIKVLLHDDNDGDLSNGTPHLDDILQAARQHNLLLRYNRHVARLNSFGDITHTVLAIDSIIIRGTADTTSTRWNFGQYQLFWSDLAHPEQWHPIENPVRNPVTNGVLGIWHPPPNQAGLFNIKLVVTPIDIPLEYTAKQVIVLTSSIPQQITNSSTIPKYNLSLSNNYLTWEEGFVRQQREGYTHINLYDLHSRTISNVFDRSSSPFLFGDYLTFSKINPGSLRINTYLYNLVNGTENAISPNVPTQLWPNGDNMFLLWEEGYRNQIVLYNMNTHSQSRIVDYNIPNYSRPNDSALSNINGNYVTWEKQGNLLRYENWHIFLDDKIFLYDLTTHTQRQISPPANYDHPSISGNYVVWRESIRTPFSGSFLSSGLKIYLFDIARNARISLPSQYTIDSEIPAINGNYIVWSQNGKLLIYRIATGQTRALAYTTHTIDSVSIYGQKVAFTIKNNLENPSSTVFLVDIPSGF